jgi:serine/threonine protein kinase
MIGSTLSSLLIFLAAVAGVILALVFIAVPLFKGLGHLIGGFFKAIGWLIAHLFEFVVGVVTDLLRFIGAVPTLAVFAFLALLQVLVGRWSAANHYAAAVVNECKVGAGCLYRVLLRRPLKLVWAHGLLEGLEERVPQVFEAAPAADLPSKATGQFPGYTIVGSLKGGGSGAKLYVARPEDRKRGELAGSPDLVVIKSFALTDGSSLPQIIRESRALECAKTMGHVLDHGMDEHRFHYVMPYIPGDNLGMVTRQLHGEADSAGLNPAATSRMMVFAEDLVTTLAQFHQCGLWHKDVKPENVIVYNGRAHIVDLGLLTPLHSAMTLTTHGTEYFRDPEMVRQALRGVKVHQVDGAKFDIYGAGAVLYFMMENTFPAHGALSAFSKKSPESLRWIVKRAMTDYAKRYESASAMLADLQCVRQAADPYAVRPADLPSMRESTVAESALAHAPAPHAIPAAILAPTLHPAPAAVPVPSSASRPRLRVINWLTGRYVVEDLALQPAIAAYAAAPFTPAAFTPAAPPPPARLTAAEQLASARHRAKEMQARARTRLNEHFVRRHSRVPAALWLIALAVVAAPVVLVARSMNSADQAATYARRVEHGLAPLPSLVPGRVLVILEDTDDWHDIKSELQRDLSPRMHGRWSDSILYQMSDDDELNDLAAKTSDREKAALARLDGFAAQYQAAAIVAVPTDGDPVVYEPGHLPTSKALDTAGRMVDLAPGLKLAVVNTHPTPVNPTIVERVDGAIASLAKQGLTTDRSNLDAIAELSLLLPRWLEKQDGAVAALEAAFARYNYDGVLWIDAEPGPDPAPQRWAQRVVIASKAPVN